jgi:hypothetical protein
MTQSCQFAFHLKKNESIINLFDLLLGEEVSVLLEGSGSQGILLPEIRLKVCIGLTKSVEKSLDEVTHGTGVTTSGGVAIRNTGHGQQTLSSGRGHKSSTAGSGDEANTDGTTLCSHLGRDSVGHATLTSPVSTTDGSDVELGSQDGTTDSSGNLRGALDTKTNVSSGITHGNEGLKASTLTGRTLLLDRHDLHHLILELILKEVVDDLGLLDGDGEEEDLLDRANLSLLNKTSELGDGDPDILVTSALTTAAATASAAVSASTSSASAASKTSAFFRHD